MVPCHDFRQSVYLGLYVNRQQRNKTLFCISCKTMGNKHSQITFFTQLLALDKQTLPMETEPWVLSKIMLSFLLYRRSAHVREKRMKKISFVVIHFISAYIFSAILPVRILFGVSVICLEYSAQFEKKKDLTGRFCSKEAVNLSPAVALRFFPLLCWHC